ncbi:hypothetical protein [Streptomyces sp. NPDC059271]
MRLRLNTAEARIIVTAVLRVVDNAARTGATGGRPDLADHLVEATLMAR